MASDYGDEVGSKMIDDFMRFGERMGERAMYARAGQMQRAFQNATREARAAAGEEAPAEGRSEWAKLDMRRIDDGPPRSRFLKTRRNNKEAYSAALSPDGDIVNQIWNHRPPMIGHEARIES